MSNGEQLVRAAGVTLCFETFGDRRAPAILLIHGAGASMLWWDHRLCTQLADNGRFVIRYDNRDTGRSTTYPPGEPGYSLTTMAADALTILDVLGIRRAHVVARSMAGAIGLALAVDHPDRVASLTFVSSTTGDPDLPSGTAADTGPIPDSPQVVAYIVELIRTHAGDSPYFDESATRALAEQDVARTTNMESSLTNHFQIDFDGPAGGGLSDIVAPTLVIRGVLDPIFPLAHGKALSEAVPGSSLLVLEDSGHDIPHQLHHVVAAALIRHTEE